MANRLNGKTALITGGASGIGAATANRFIEEGAKVVLADINIDKGHDTAERLGSAAEFVQLDVTNEDSWKAAMPEAIAKFGGLTTIVNSAGISVPGNIEEETFDKFKRTIEINLHGVYLGCQHGVAALKGGEGGAIVNVGSTLGFRGGSIFTSYCASKGGVRMLSKAVAAHCAEQGYNIRVNCIVPGAIHTEMVEVYIETGIAEGASREDVIEGFASGHPLKRLGAPNEPANAIVYLASDESSYTTGGDIPVDGGFLI